MRSSPDRDLPWLRRALRLAERGSGTVHPNPRVGAVIVRDGERVGEGFHARAGEAHAEARALESAGARARGATLYVTLEPCAHHGRTPPCAEAVVDAGIARVVACQRDPDPRVAGRGFARLRAAGIKVDTGKLAEEAVRLNLNWLVPRQLGRPAVTLKWAMSLDGKIATAAGESQWLSSPAARRWALGLREEHQAIVVGVGTVLADDPRLDRRLGRAAGPILRVVMDRHLRTPQQARLFDQAGPVRVFTESDDLDRTTALETAGARVTRLARVTAAAVLDELHSDGIGSVLVEGGARVATAFFDEGRYDRVHVVAAALLLGGKSSPSPLAGDGLGLQQAPRLGPLQARRVGGDIVMTGWNRQCLRELLKNAEA